MHCTTAQLESNLRVVLGTCSLVLHFWPFWPVLGPTTTCEISKSLHSEKLRLWTLKPPAVVPWANSWPKGLQTLLVKLESTRHEDNQSPKVGNRTFGRITNKSRKKWSATHGLWEEGLDRCKIIGVERAPPTQRADFEFDKGVSEGRYGCQNGRRRPEKKCQTRLTHPL